MQTFGSCSSWLRDSLQSFSSSRTWGSVSWAWLWTHRWHPFGFMTSIDCLRWLFFDQLLTQRCLLNRSNIFILTVCISSWSFFHASPHPILLPCSRVSRDSLPCVSFKVTFLARNFPSVGSQWYYNCVLAGYKSPPHALWYSFYDNLMIAVDQHRCMVWTLNPTPTIGLGLFIVTQAWARSSGVFLHFGCNCMISPLNSWIRDRLTVSCAQGDCTGCFSWCKSWIAFLSLERDPLNRLNSCKENQFCCLKS